MAAVFIPYFSENNRLACKLSSIYNFCLGDTAEAGGHFPPFRLLSISSPNRSPHTKTKSETATTKHISTPNEPPFSLRRYSTSDGDKKTVI